MRELNAGEICCVAGAYGDNIGANIGEGVICLLGGAVLVSWLLAIQGGSAAFKHDLVGIGGGLTALAGMVGGAFLGAAAGAVIGPFIGYDRGLKIASDMIYGLMKGMPGKSA